MDDDTYAAVRRWAQLLLRAAATAAAVLACGQPVLAGGFLQGHYSRLAAHREAAMVLAGAILLTLPAALLMWRPGRAPGRLPALCGLAFLMCGGQIGLGFARVLIVHIPLGIALLGLVLYIAVTAWRMPLTAPGREAAPAPVESVAVAEPAVGA
jgi:uncharacterized membrane protein YozB (DUF420 family)